MAKVTYELENHVAVVTLNDNDNRFTPDFLNAFLSVLDEIENDTNATTMVVTSSHDKIFSNGINLEWLMTIDREKDPNTFKSFLYLLNKLLKRTLMCPLLTIASINGHAFAGGAIWSCAFDFRLMRADRGFFCFPEADLNVPFLHGMTALVRKAVPSPYADEMMLTGIRLTAQECVEKGIVKEAYHQDQLMEKSMEFAAVLNKDRRYIKDMRHKMYKDIVHAIEIEDAPLIELARFGFQ